MARKMIKNCKVIKEALVKGIGEPGKEQFNGKEYCQGYVANEDDDEPYYKCQGCYLNIFYKK
jgi:hypothetical protein